MARLFVERSAKNLWVVANPADPEATDPVSVTAILGPAEVMRVGISIYFGSAPPSDGLCCGSEGREGGEGVAVTTTGGRGMELSDAAERRQG